MDMARHIGVGQIASAKMRSKSARVHGRGLVWWQMSLIGDLDQRRNVGARHRPLALR